MDPMQTTRQWSPVTAIPPRRFSDSPLPARTHEHAEGDTEYRESHIAAYVRGIPAFNFEHTGEDTENNLGPFSMHVHPAHQFHNSPPPAHTHQYARGDTENRFWQYPLPVRPPYPLYNSPPPAHTHQYARGDTERRFWHYPLPVRPPYPHYNTPPPARSYENAGGVTERRSRSFDMPSRSPYQPSIPPPLARTHQEAGGDTGNSYSPLSMAVRPPWLFDDPSLLAWRNTNPANGGQTPTGGTVTPPVTQPSPTHTGKNCSITLCSNSSTQRYPPTRFGVLEIKREQDGRKTTDHEVFMVFRKIYYGRLRPPSQRLLSFRGLKHIVFAEFTNEEQPIPLVVDAKLQREIMHVFNNPHVISTDDTWVNLICGLGEDPNHDYGLLFVDDWDRQKIAVLVGVPWIVSVVTAILWIAGTGDIEKAMAVSSYIMSATGVVVGLLAVLSAIEA